MTAPTAAQIREWSKVDFNTLGFSDDADLQVLVDRSVTLFAQITGRPVDATMPVEYDRAVEQVIQRMVEVLAFQAQQEYVETLSDFQLIASFSAGSYSETRRSLTEIKDARMLVADPALNALLLTLLTPDMQDFWIGWWSGQIPPGFEVTEVAWMLGSGFDHPAQYPYGAEPITNYGPWSW